MVSFLRGNLRWLAGGLLLMFTNAFGQAWLISLFAGEIKSAHGLSDGDWGVLFSIATLASAALLFYGGSLADTIPLSRLAVGTSLLYALACVGMAFAGTLWLLALSLFALRFAGQSMFGHIAMTAMGRWFRARRGQAVAIVNLGNPAAKAFWPLPAALMLVAFGDRITWLAMAAFLAIVVTPSLAWLMSRSRAPQGRLEADLGTPGLGGRHWTRAEALHHWLFPALIPQMMTGGFIVTSAYIHQVHIGEVNGWSLASMAPGYTFSALTAVLAAFVAGWVSDRWGAEKLLPWSPLPLGLGILMIGSVDGVWGWIVGFTLIGFNMGIGGTLWGALLPRLYGTRHLGSVRSLMTVFMVASSAIGPAVTGLLIDAGVPFSVQCLWMGAWCLGLCAVSFLILRRLSVETAAIPAGDA